ncbi:MAG: succinate dehydrogenase, hydrophobic membrane anchor protein [Immundisolibacteraceae bacterium]|nr:succinate dehydrogenase, hydrophobic membrane anchor protein [Immundisolibacteraceae bacterium]
MSQFRSARSAARNHGSSGGGTGDFILERFTALGLMLLVLPLGLQLMMLSQGGITLEEARSWLGNPINSGLVVLFFLIGMLHTFIASKVLLEDYVHIPGIKVLMIFGLSVVTVVTAAIATVSSVYTLFIGLV